MSNEALLEVLEVIRHQHKMQWDALYLAVEEGKKITKSDMYDDGHHNGVMDLIKQITDNIDNPYAMLSPEDLREVFGVWAQIRDDETDPYEVWAEGEDYSVNFYYGYHNGFVYVDGTVDMGHSTEEFKTTPFKFDISNLKQEIQDIIFAAVDVIAEDCPGAVIEHEDALKDLVRDIRDEWLTTPDED